MKLGILLNLSRKELAKTPSRALFYDYPTIPDERQRLCPESALLSERALL